MPAMLEGVRIVDLTTVVFGPYATQMLADLGADVIKIEPPGGDAFRIAGKPARTRGMGGCHMAINRGKRSVVLDLKAPDDLQTMRALLQDADIFIHNVRDEAIQRLGLGYGAVKAIKPDIVYVHCVGFGSDGPYAGLQAYDDIIQAATGAASLAGRVDGDPKPRYIPSLVADKVAGLYGAYAMLGALTHKLRTGEGQFVEAPMFESFAHFILEEHLCSGTFVPPTGPLGYPRQLDPNRQPFPTRDGWISVVPYTDASLVKIFQLMGRPDVLEEEAFSTPRGRGINVSELYRRIGEITPERTTAEWLAMFHAADIPALPVRDLQDMPHEPHLRASGFLMEREHPTEGRYLDMRPPIRFGAPYTRRDDGAPGLGQHTDDVRAEAAKATLAETAGTRNN